MTRTVATAALAMAMAVGVAAEKKPQEPAVTVFMVQPSAQFVDQELQNKIDSTKDLLEYMGRDKGIQKTMRVVATREEAQVVLEVLGRGTVGTGEMKTTVTSNPYTGPVAKTTEQTAYAG